MKFGISNIIPILFFFLSIQPSYSDTTDFELDLDAMWENTVWNEIEDVVDVGYEWKKFQLRCSWTEDELILYYRRSMKGLSKLDLQKALGKLIIKRTKMDDDNPDVKKIDGFILQLRNKLKSA